jgi:hypothetical protein
MYIYIHTHTYTYIHQYELYVHMYTHTHTYIHKYLVRLGEKRNSRMEKVSRQFKFNKSLSRTNSALQQQDENCIVLCSECLEWFQCLIHFNCLKLGEYCPCCSVREPRNVANCETFSILEWRERKRERVICIYYIYILYIYYIYIIYIYI